MLIHNAQNSAPPVAFVRYSCRADAEAARAQMQDYPQGPSSEKHIRVEYAKSNSKPPKHPRQWYTAGAHVDTYASAGMKRPAMEANPYAQCNTPQLPNPFPVQQ